MISLTDLGFAASQAWGSVCLAESCQAEVCFSNESIAMVIKHFSLLNVLSPEMPKLFTQLKCFSQHQNIGMDYYPSGGSNQNTGKEGESGLLMPTAKRETESGAEVAANTVQVKPNLVHLQIYCPPCVGAETMLSFFFLSQPLH